MEIYANFFLYFIGVFMVAQALPPPLKQLMTRRGKTGGMSEVDLFIESSYPTPPAV